MEDIFGVNVGYTKSFCEHPDFGQLKSQSDTKCKLQRYNLAHSTVPVDRSKSLSH